MAFHSVKLTPQQIESWVAKHFVYKKRKSGAELLICNPFVPGDRGFKFNISTKLKKTKRGASGYWVYDWRPSASGYNGSFIKFVQNYKGLSFRDALKDICGTEISFSSLLPRTYAEEEDTELIIEMPENAIPIDNPKWPRLQKLALGYLKSRGITHKDATAYKLHYTPTMIVFPYIEYDMIVYWQARTFSKVIKQFLFPEISKSAFLYGFDNAEPGQPVYLTEAIFDALSIGPGGMAIGGATLQEEQRRKLRAINPSYIVLAPDNDTEGKASLYHNYNLLKSYYTIYYVLPPNPHKDWNDMVCSFKDKSQGISEVKEYVEKYAKKLTPFEAIKFRKETRRKKFDYLTSDLID